MYIDNKVGENVDIKGYLSRLFKTKELGMISLNDMAYIPTRNELNNELAESLDEYKDNYKEVLLQDKYITSHDISSKDYSDDMIMNFYLFNRLIVNQDEVYNLDTVEEYKRNELFLKYKINPYKILLYVDKMEEIYNETLLRLIALKEIVNELELDKNKIDAIKNEIDTLTTHYIIFKNNLYASLMEINHLKNNVNHQFDRYNEYSSNLLVKAYYNRIKKYYEVLMPDKFKEIDKEELPLINKLANLELELEIYCYNNIDVNKLNEELQEIDKIEKNIDNKENLLQKINDLVLRYEILNRYGGYELDLSPLYEVKFDILTIDIVKQEDSPFKGIDNEREMKYYKDIIANMITTYITGVDSILNNQLDENNKDIIECFIEILKNNDKFDFNNILMDKFKLCLLLNIPDSNKILELFDNALISISYNNKKINASSYGIVLDEVVPLSTLCRFRILYEKSKKLFNLLLYFNPIIKFFAKIYEYYEKKEKINDESVYKVPEGIIKIDCVQLKEGLNDEALKYLVNKIYGKTVIMPSSLQIFTSNDLFKDVSIPKIVLNEGFNINYDYYPFICNDTKSITIPKTLENISLDFKQCIENECNSYATLNELIFTDFEDSLLLNDKHNREILIKNLINMIYYVVARFIIGDTSFNYKKEMKLILVDKNKIEHTIALDDIFYYKFFRLEAKRFLFEYMHSKKIDVDINREVILPSCFEANKKIDELLAQYTKQKENSHKM